MIRFLADADLNEGIVAGLFRMLENPRWISCPPMKRKTYPSPGHVTPANENYLVVYTPPNYDVARAKPYPAPYLSHGGGDK